MKQQRREEQALLFFSDYFCGFAGVGEAENIFEERMAVVTLAKGRTWKWRKRLKAE
jgi:hypothetical protein